MIPSGECNGAGATAHGGRGACERAMGVGAARQEAAIAALVAGQPADRREMPPGRRAPSVVFEPGA